MPVAPTDLEQTAIASATWLPGYELFGLIGAGGHGQVFKARQLNLDRVVAVKLVDLGRTVVSDPTARFEREAVALGRFHHPNIVPVFDYGRHNNHLFMAMELLEGEDLGRRLCRVGRLDERIAWLVVRQAAAGPGDAAANGVIHRDVKPSNLFLVPAPTGVDLSNGTPMVKVMDFGLAQANWQASPDDELHTAPGVIVGTPAYMAPEQHRSGDVDLRADIYALGATAYHAISGRPPFTGRTVWEIMTRKVRNVPPLFAEMSPESAELIQAMMAPNLDSRLATYEDLIARIDQLSLKTGRRRVRRAIRGLRTHWQRIASGAGVAAALVGIEIGRAPRTAANASPSIEYVSTGGIESLFDGASLGRWSSSGAWAVSKDDEGVPVVFGTGLIRRPFVARENYRVTIGLDVHEATAVEIHFALPVGGGGSRHVLRVSREAGAVVGSRNGDRAPFVSIGEPISFPPPNWFKDRRPYLEVRIERCGENWAAWFRGELVGRIADDGAAKLQEIHLFAQDGRARFDSVVLERLRPRDE